MRKPVLRVSDQVRHKPTRDCTINVEKTKALIRCAVTTQLICIFVFAYAKSRFSNDAAQIVAGSTFWSETKHSFLTAVHKMISMTIFFLHMAELSMEVVIYQCVIVDIEIHDI